MADTNFSARIEGNDKEKLLQYISESGKTQKDFMNVLISIYEMSKSKSKNANLIGDIEELETYTLKINKVFLNMIDKLEGQKLLLAEDLEKELSIYKGKVQDQEDKISIIENENNDYVEYITSLREIKESNEKQIVQLEQTVQDKTELVEEYKNKNDMLLTENLKYKEAYEELEEIKKLLIGAENEVDKLKNSNEILEENNIKLGETIKDNNIKHEQVIKEMQKDTGEKIEQIELDKKQKIDDIKNISNERIEALKLQHEKDIENIKAASENEKSKSILDIKQIYQDEMKKLHEEYQSKINKYQSDINALVEHQLDKKKE